ncbi:MAG: oligosaccharide flippase family protein [Pelolinea sp.]|nr:oligosaccharide flippase family protein [Pelolinea sp.]
MLSGIQAIKWGVKGSISIIDQAVYSGANFIFIVLLARWLEPKDFGAFSVTYAIFSIFYQLHNGFISEPMSVLGPASYSTNERSYLKIQTKLHFLFTFGAGFVYILVTFISRLVLQPMSNNNHHYIYLGLVIPFMLLPWFVRRTYYFLKKPHYAAFTSIAYAVFLFSLTFVFKSAILQKTETAYFIMATAGFAACILFLNLIRRAENQKLVKLGAIIKQNWNYGKWIILTGFLVSIANQMQILVIGSVGGLEDAGIIRALQNFIQPMIVIISAISILVLPIFSAQFGKPEAANFKRNGALITYVVFIISLIYGLFLWIFRLQLENLFYGSKYVDYVNLIPLISLVPIFTALSIGASVILRAIQKPQALFVVSIGGFITSVFTSFVFIKIWGITGALWSAVITQAVSTFIFIVLMARR